MAKQETEPKQEEVIKEDNQPEEDIVVPEKDEESPKHIAPAKATPAPRGKPGFGKQDQTFDVDSWKPKTEVGKKVKLGEITNIDQVLNTEKIILESEIVDALLPSLESDLLLIGQSKGKFGGGQRRVFRQTQKKTKEGNKPSFATCAVVGDRNGHVGIGYGKSRETVPAREKAVRMAKINLVKIRRGCGSWQCTCKEPHSIPFEVEGKCGSVKVKLMPAPKGTGLCVGSEIAKVLKLAGVQDVWSKTEGKTTSRVNMTQALMKALEQIMTVKVQSKFKDTLNISE